MSKPTEEELKDVFGQFDTDGSGFVDAKELRNILTQMGCPDSEIESAIQEMLGEADADGDHKVSYAEFKKVLLSE